MLKSRHKWDIPAKIGDKVRRLDDSNHREMEIGKIYTIKTLKGSLVYLEGCSNSYSINFFEPAELISTENYQIF